MDIRIEAKHFPGKPNPWRVTMTVPGQADPIIARIDAPDEEAAKVAAWERFVRTLARREKGEARLTRGGR